MTIHSSPLKPARSASVWLVADAIGAVIFAAALSQIIAFQAGLGGFGLRLSPLHLSALPSAGWLIVMIAAGWLRAFTLVGAAVSGQSAAGRAKQAWRATLHPVLLATTARRGRIAGEELRRAVDDIEASEGLVARFLSLRLAAVLSPLLIAVAVAPASWFAALILLVTLALFGLAMALAGTAARSEADRQLSALTRLSALFVDRVRQLPLILAYGAEDRVTRQLEAASREVAERTVRVLRVAFASSAAIDFFAALSVALVAVYFGFSLLGLLPFPAPEQLDLGRAFYALALAPEFYLPMRRLAAAYHDKQQGEAALRALDETRAAALAALPAPAPARYDLSKLETDCLVVGYSDGTRLAPVTACWNGQGLHVVSGETGSGKSSLLLALAGFTEIISGRVMVDRREQAPGALQSLIGWSGQAPMLLPGTLADNLRVAAPAATDSQLEAMLTSLGLRDLLSRRGLALAIDPRGSGLSGGERRRIGLARALLSQRPLLLLDEPTADLDPASAALVIAALAEAARTRIVLAATHDPALVRSAVSNLVLP